MEGVCPNTANHHKSPQISPRRPQINVGRPQITTNHRKLPQISPGRLQITIPRPQNTAIHRQNTAKYCKSVQEDRKLPQITTNHRKSLLEDHKSMLEYRKSLSQDHRTSQYTGRTQPNTANQSWKAGRPKITANHRKSLQEDHLSMLEYRKSLSQDHRTPQITVRTTANHSQNQGCSPRGICLGSSHSETPEPLGDTGDPETKSKTPHVFRCWSAGQGSAHGETTTGQQRQSPVIGSTLQ